jgi:hypothetical protein
VSADRIPDHDRPEEDVDAAFARIIAGWDDASAPAQRPRRDDVPVDAPPSGNGSPPASPSPAPPFAASDPAGELPPTAGPASFLGGAARGPRDHIPAEEPDEGYVPPIPPPLPRGDVAQVLSWAAVIFGPLFLLFAGLFWRDANPLWLALAVMSFVGGFVALVMRLPTHRDDGADDDGAVV